MQIHPNSFTINKLLGSNNEQYVIPTYQRRYSWKPRQVWELIEDIQLIENNDTHLLGSIVCLVGHHQALNRLELVDGQQRLTTITILLECIRQYLDKHEQKEDAAEIARLLIAKPLAGKPLKKISLDSIDASEFDQLVQNESDQPYQNAQLQSTFEIVRDWISTKSVDQLSAFLYRLLNQSIVIRLDVSEAKDAFKLFETINNRGLRLSPTDIIKNFLLGNAARFGDDSLGAARSSWTALIQYLDGTNSDAFFRYYLMAILKVRLTASGVVPEFKKVFMSQVAEAGAFPVRHLYADPDELGEDDADEVTELAEEVVIVKSTDKVSFKEFLQRLVQNAKVYGELVLVKTSDPSTNRHLRNLRMIKAVQTYGFLMHLRVGGCTDKHFREILQLTESFVLRRHVCRERSNDTEALFARLCGTNPKAPIQATKDAYRELSPADDKFRDEFATASFTANVIDRARYCLEHIEMSKHGMHDEIQVLGAEDVHVEHIMPQKIKTNRAKDEFGDWVTYLGDKADVHHQKYVSRIGNLTIFAGALNIGASNNPFQKKKQAYKESSIRLTQDLLKMSNFKFKDIEKRSKDLADIAVGLWPMP